MPLSYKIFGQELAPYVVEWGETEEVKEVLLAQAQLFVSQHVIVLANADGRFTPKKEKSLFYGRNTQQVLAQLSRDGMNLFTGFIRSIEVDSVSRTVSITTQNVFTVPANSAVVLTAAGANPAYAIQAILEQVGLSAHIDPVSFASAGAAASAAGATVNLAYPQDSTTTALGAIQAISELCSLSCYVQGGLIRLRAWRPYQGSGDGVKYAVTTALARQFSGLVDLYSNLVNSVTISYDAASTYTQTTPESIRLNGTTTAKTFSCTTDGELSVPDLVSAEYFAGLFLQRASTLKQQGSLVVGPEMQSAHIGDRITVAAPAWSTDAIAMEIIEVHQAASSDSLEITCVTI